MAAPPRQAYHQDYMVRIRYSNNLPPPPMPPKLLDIPNTGLSSGEYTSAAFASRLAREQTLNVEADAELGMPIDLVGIPGVFDNDESAIQSHEHPPPLNPRDRALLRPLATLGKPTSAAHGVSFLRRTEYITGGAAGAGRIEAKSPNQRTPKRRRPQDGSKDDPVFIMRSVMKGFDIAYPADAYAGPDKNDMLRAAVITPDEKAAWQFPRHPTKPDVKLLDAYPLLPDADGLPTGAGYNIVRFGAPPLPYAPTDRYDARLDAGLLRAINTSRVQEKYETRRVQDPTFRGAPEFDYEYFLPASAAAVRGIKRKFSVAAPDRDDESLYDTLDAEQPCFRYEKLRSYETATQAVEMGDDVDRFEESVVIALHDGGVAKQRKVADDEDVDEDEGSMHRRMQKGAYLYPIVGRVSLKPKRDIKGIQRTAAWEEEQLTQPVDVVELTVREPDDEEVAVRQAIREKVFELAVPTVEA